MRSAPLAAESAAARDEQGENEDRLSASRCTQVMRVRESRCAAKPTVVHPGALIGWRRDGGRAHIWRCDH